MPRQRPRREAVIPTALQESPKYKEASNYLDSLFERWPWAFARYELGLLLRKKYGVHKNNWNIVLAYIRRRKEAKDETKLYDSLTWQELFPILLGSTGSKGNRELPKWAVPVTRIRENTSIIFFGRKREHLWARIFFECEQAFKNIQAVPSICGINLLQALINAKADGPKAKKIPLKIILSQIMFDQGTKPDKKRCKGILRKLIKFGLVEETKHSFYKDMEHSEFTLSQLAREAYGHIGYCINSDKSITKCRARRPPFNLARAKKLRGKAKRRIPSHATS